MAAYNLLGQINSQIFQFRYIKGCKLHFWLNALAFLPPADGSSSTSFPPPRESLLDLTRPS